MKISERNRKCEMTSRFRKLITVAIALVIVFAPFQIDGFAANAGEPIPCEVGNAACLESVMATASEAGLMDAFNDCLMTAASGSGDYFSVGDGSPFQCIADPIKCVTDVVNLVQDVSTTVQSAIKDVHALVPDLSWNDLKTMACYMAPQLLLDGLVALATAGTIGAAKMALTATRMVRIIGLLAKIKTLIELAKVPFAEAFKAMVELGDKAKEKLDRLMGSEEGRKRVADALKACMIK